MYQLTSEYKLSCLVLNLFYNLWQWLFVNTIREVGKKLTCNLKMVTTYFQITLAITHGIKRYLRGSFLSPCSMCDSWCLTHPVCCQNRSPYVRTESDVLLLKNLYFPISNIIEPWCSNNWTVSRKYSKFWRRSKMKHLIKIQFILLQSNTRKIIRRHRSLPHWFVQ